MQPRRGFTYYDHALAQADLEAGGRFAAVNKATVTPAPMPALPEGSPWHADPVGQEPPIGYSIDEQPPVGEPHELANAASGSPPGVVEQAGWPAKAVGLARSAASSIEPAELGGHSAPVALAEGQAQGPSGCLAAGAHFVERRRAG
jgi:hypothetical protein